MKGNQSSGNRQKGTALTWVVSLFFIFILGALIIDGSMLYHDKRKLQSVANSLAAKLAGMGQTCSDAVLSGEDVDLLVSESDTIENLYDESDPMSDFYEKVDVNSASRVLISTVNGKHELESVSRALESNGVKVVISRPASGLLAFVANDLVASSAAKKQIYATFSASGDTLSVGMDSSKANIVNSLLGVLLNDGSPYSFSVLELEELGGLTVRLGDLLSDVGVGGVINSLPVDGEALAGQLGSLFDDLATPVGGLVDDLLYNSVGLEGVKVEDILILVGEGSSVPENAEIPVYDLIVSLAMSTLVGVSDLPPIELNIPGLARVSAKLIIDSPPVIAVGPAMLKKGEDPLQLDGWETNFSGAQVKASIEVHLLEALDLLAGVDLPLIVETGLVRGAFVAAECASGVDNTVQAAVKWETGIASVRTGIIDEEGLEKDDDLSVSLLGGLVTIPLNLDVSLVSDGGSAPNPVVFSADLAKLKNGLSPPPSEVVGGGLGLNIKLTRGDRECSNILDCVLTVTLDALLRLLDVTLLPLVNNTIAPLLSDLIVDDLLSLLGLGLGMGEIEMSGVTQSLVIIEGV